MWLAVVAIGVLTNGVYLGLLYTALRYLSAGMAAIIASTNPLLLALVAPRLLGERITSEKVLGMCIGFGGVAFLSWSRASASTDRPLDAAVAMISVVGLVGSAVVYKRSAFQSRDVIGVTAFQLLIGAILLLPIAVTVEGSPSLPETSVAWAAMTYLVVVMSVGASLLWFWLLTHRDATRASAYYFLVPVVGLVLSRLTLGERLWARDLAGAAAIAAGIALVQRPGLSTPPRVPSIRCRHE
jgi:drug/metabolite transporter (DMT)-like permease